MKNQRLNTFFRLILALAFLAGMLGIPAVQPAWAAEGDAVLVLGQPDFATATSGTTAAKMFAPAGVAVDPTSGKVFVAEVLNNRVLRFASFAALSSGAAAEGVLGQANFTSGLPNRGGDAAANTLANPTGVAVDAGGRLWVADNANHRVLRFEAAANKANGADAEGVLGQADFTSSLSNRGGSVAANTLYQPYGMAVEADGRLWVADWINNRVLRFEAAANKANGADADGVLGQADFTSGLINRGGSVAANTLYRPTGVAVDADGRLWVADTSNSRLLRFEAAASKTNGADAEGVLGQADFTSGSANRGGSVAANTLANPTGVAVEAAGRLWAADGGNNRVLAYDINQVDLFKVFLAPIFK